MCWSNLSSESESQPRSPLWSLEEAELTYSDDGPRIGFAQVGLDFSPTIDTGDPVSPLTQPQEDVAKREASTDSHGPQPIERGPSTNPVVAIPPLVECLNDALGWFGEAEVLAVQVTATYIATERRSRLSSLTGVLNWFNMIGERRGASAVVTVAADRWDERVAAQVYSFVQRVHSGSFEFGPLLVAPEGCAVQPDWQHIEWASVGGGLAVSMPSWSAAAAGWLIGLLFEAILSRNPEIRHLSVRVTRCME